MALAEALLLWEDSSALSEIGADPAFLVLKWFHHKRVGEAVSLHQGLKEQSTPGTRDRLASVEQGI